MTRLSSAPQTELAPDVYEASLKPLEYLGIDNVPTYDQVATTLAENETPMLPADRLIVVPPELESLRLKEWDLLLRVAFKINQAARSAGAYIPGNTIANLEIHETFKRYEPNLIPDIPTIAARINPQEIQGITHNVSFAAYVLYQLGATLDDEVALRLGGKKTVLESVEPTVYEAETFDPLKIRTTWLTKRDPKTKEPVKYLATVQGGRAIRSTYDIHSQQDRMVAPALSLVALKGQDALTVAEPRLQAYRWAETVEKRMAPATPEGQEVLEEWVGKFPTTGIEEVRVNPGHVGIAVLPRTVSGLSYKK